MNAIRMAALGLAIISGSAAHAQWTQRASVDAAGAQSNGGSAYPVISADGRFAAFESLASNLVPNDTNGLTDVFVRDLQTGAIERASVSSAGVQGNGDSSYAAISADGRYVAFQSRATNLVAGDTTATQDVFVHDRASGLTERVSLSTLGAQGNKDSMGPSVSADGRFVAFMSQASNLVTPDFTSTFDVFLRDRASGTTVRVSSAWSGGPGNLHSYWPAVSADGRYVAYTSAASNIVSTDFNGTLDVFVYDVQTATNELASVSTGGVQGDFASTSPSLSADGRYMSFHSIAMNLVAGDTNGVQDVFLRDRVGGTTERIDLGPGGLQADGDCGWTSIGADGNYVAFEGGATNLVSGDTNGQVDIFLFDRIRNTLERVNVDNSGTQANGVSAAAGVSTDGRWVVFGSSATNLVSGDTNAVDDVFLRDRFAAGFTSLCDAGTGSVLACPCGNPPAGSGQGCDNSDATGGAALSAAGAAYVSNDQLLFTTSGEKPTATSIVLQGNAQLTTGVVFGQGVRCAGGLLKRLYTKIASGGSILAPDSGAGDASVSARSAAVGDTILAGESRWYLVYYRDPVVLGGCPVANTFNATQTGEVRWSP